MATSKGTTVITEDKGSIPANKVMPPEGSPPSGAVIDLSSPAANNAYLWLINNTEARADAVDLLSWRIGTSELHWQYKRWLSYSPYGEQAVSLSDMWGIIQIAYPWVTIVGKQGARAFAGMRRNNA